MKIQVKRNHYFKNYDDLPRFSSYLYLIDQVKKIKPKKILEIGVGNKTVSNYLNEAGFDIKTMDIDKTLNPDIMGDVTNIPLKDNSFDLVIACEVLEHLPFDKLDISLKEIARVSKKTVIVSIPYSNANINLIFKFPLIRTLLNKKFIEYNISIPLFFKGFKFDGQHYWEMGRKGYPASLIRKKIRKYFRIKEEGHPPLNSYHHFFILIKK